MTITTFIFADLHLRTASGTLYFGGSTKEISPTKRNPNDKNPSGCSVSIFGLSGGKSSVGRSRSQNPKVYFNISTN